MISSKQKQWIGDAVFTLLTRNYLAEKYPASKKFDHSVINVKYNKISCNQTMGKLAVEFGVITNRQRQDMWMSKHGGNEFEEYVYGLYAANDMAFMEAWFIFDVVPVLEKILGPVFFIIK